MFIDLGAEKVIAAEKGLFKIAVEIKTFSGLSKVADLEQAAGQYVLYRVALRRVEPERRLYLAVPQTVMQSLFLNRELWQALVADEDIFLFRYDEQKAEVIQWLPQIV